MLAGRAHSTLLTRNGTYREVQGYHLLQCILIIKEWGKTLIIKIHDNKKPRNIWQWERFFSGRPTAANRYSTRSLNSLLFFLPRLLSWGLDFFRLFNTKQLMCITPADSADMLRTARTNTNAPRVPAVFTRCAQLSIELVDVRNILWSSGNFSEQRLEETTDGPRVLHGVVVFRIQCFNCDAKVLVVIGSR